MYALCSPVNQVSIASDLTHPAELPWWPAQLKRVRTRILEYTGSNTVQAVFFKIIHCSALDVLICFAWFLSLSCIINVGTLCI